ncbi:hypothetical protein [Wolbachia endosymbiont (group A) of Sphecodes ephippius]|nr:hypothetical protein [Wolbachia endosymbiont (group A) of Sphecodes ephippius]
MQFTLGEDSRCESPSEETFDCLLEDLGYASRSSTPIKLPNSLLTESYERNQSESICKTQQ